MSFHARAWLPVVLMLGQAANANIIGTNPPSLPITRERIATLPAKIQPDWIHYLERSERQRQEDQGVLLAELKKLNLIQALVPPQRNPQTRLSLDRSDEWYRGPEGRRIADIIVSFQTPAGGWSKNLDLTHHRRAPGEHFSGEKISPSPIGSDHDRPRDLNWNYVGTFDNDATTTQLRYLAKVITSLGPEQAAEYRAAFLRGMNYIFASQFPNGGWPQVWPLQGGYHDAITYNDGAMINILSLVRDVARGENEFAFVPRNIREQAAASLPRGIKCIVDTQIKTGSRRTVWCQQHDPLTLKPASARNYEMPAQCGSESAGIAQFLMRISQPSQQVAGAVHDAAAWFEKTRLNNLAFKKADAAGKRLIPTPGAPPIWARFYEIGTDKPIFGDRDQTIHDVFEEISRERREGYSWFSDSPRRCLEAYANWKGNHPVLQK